MDKGFLRVFLAVLVFGFISATAIAQTLAFHEDRENRTLVIWDDITLTADKSYETIVVMKGNVELLGKTENLILVSGTVTLKEGAEVTDKLLIIEGRLFSEPGSKLGNVRSWNWQDWIPWRSGDWNWNWQKSWAGSFDIGNLIKSLLTLPVIAIFTSFCIFLLLALGAFFIFATPEWSRRSDDILRTRPLLSCLWGLTIFLMTVPILFVLTISIVGIFLIPIFLLFLVFWVFAGFFCLARTLGYIVLRSQDRAFLATALGILVILLVQVIPLIGQFAFFIAVSAGLGAVISALLSPQRQNLDVGW